MITNLNSNLFRPNIIYIILKFGQVYKWFKTMVGIQKNHPLIRKKYIKLSINQTSQLELIYAKEKYHAQMNKMVVWCCSCLASRGSNLAHRWFDIYIHTYIQPSFWALVGCFSQLWLRRVQKSWPQGKFLGENTISGCFTDVMWPIIDNSSAMHGISSFKLYNLLWFNKMNRWNIFMLCS